MLLNGQPYLLIDIFHLSYYKVKSHMRQNKCMFYRHHRTHPYNCRHMNPKYFYICHIHDTYQYLCSVLWRSYCKTILLGNYGSPTYLTFVDIVTNSSVAFKTNDAFANMGSNCIVTCCKYVTKMTSAITLRRRFYFDANIISG